MRSAPQRSNEASRLWENKSDTFPIPTEGEPPADWNEATALEAILADTIW